jgi:hypothetical protein
MSVHPPANPGARPGRYPRPVSIGLAAASFLLLLSSLAGCELFRASRDTVFNSQALATGHLLYAGHVESNAAFALRG